jgi:acyl-coenzyme A synthetase/AMP-(fatty) acid ligase/acyl carrier protein
LLWNHLYKRTASISSALAGSVLRRKTFGKSVRFMISGGGAIAAEVVSRLNDLGFPLYNGYGATETGITSLCLEPDPERRKDANIGEPLFDVTFGIVPLEGSVSTGELTVSSSFLYDGILSGGIFGKRPAGAYNTGDIASRSKSGQYRILGREDGMISAASGEKVLAEEIEPHFTALNGVTACLAGRTAPGRGDGIMLLIETDAGVDLPKVNQAVADENAKLPARLQVTEAYASKNPFPKASGFKVKRRALLAAFASRPGDFIRLNIADANKARYPREQIDKALMKRLKLLLSGVLDTAPADIGDYDDLIMTLGADSFDYAAFLTEIDKALGVKIGLADVEKLRTVADFSVYIKDHNGM